MKFGLLLLFVSVALSASALANIDISLGGASMPVAQSGSDEKYRFSPVVMNNLDQLFAKQRKQDTLNDISDQLSAMTKKIYYRDEPVAPRERPVLEPLMEGVAKALNRVKKRTTRQGDLPRARENMETFTKLLDSVKHINKRLDPKPERFTQEKQALRNKEIQKFLYIPQPQEETEEQQAMIARAHAQSQMLHQMTHAIDRLAVNTQSDLDRKTKYDYMLNEIMHAHLSDPHYHDDLHDHLTAHHLSSVHSDDDFNEHLAQHVLYHDVGRRAENEYLHSTPQTNYAQQPQQQQPNLFQQQRSALTQNHLLEVAENREGFRHNNANLFAQQSYDKYKDMKPFQK